MVNGYVERHFTFTLPQNNKQHEGLKNRDCSRFETIPPICSRLVRPVFKLVRLLQVGSSEAALLQKLDIRPFTYGLLIECVYDNGSVFDAAVLDLTDDDMAAKFSAACGNVAAVSLELGFPTLASLPHSICNAFKALVSVVIEGCDTYSFDKADTIKVCQTLVCIAFGHHTVE